MTTHARHQIDFSTFPESDGEPMAETLPNMLQMIDLQFALHALFERQGRPQVGVGGNQLMYYNPHSGWDHVAPDVYATFAWPGPPPPSWRTWEQGGFPELVFEITSQSTWREDLGEGEKQKPALYLRLGVQEYIVYDPQGELDPPLQGWARQGEAWVALPRTAAGGLGSILLRAELRALPLGATERRPAGTWLRVLDPWTGEPIPIADEEHQRLQAVQEALQTVGETLHREEEARRAAEEAREMEALARRAAEERAARAEAALQALLAERERRPGPPPDGE